MNSDFCVAVHAILFLNHMATSLSSEQLAQNICTHPARVRRVLSKLCKSHLLKSEEGAKKGGYLFDKNANEVTLADIAKALDISFVETAWKSGNEDMDCLIASGMSKVMDEVFIQMNTRCYSYLQQISISHLEKKLGVTKKL